MGYISPMRELHPHSRFFADEDGATAIEYGLIAAMVTIFMLAGLGLFSASMSNMFSSISTQVGNAMPG